ncbi:MAG TPA: hypothetical protein PK509_17265, partial [Catalimonadaceae bacterium]|nr:hypothetical protein [Catalimonadaceae bacterium]
MKRFLLLTSFFLATRLMAQWNDKLLIPVPLENIGYFKPADGNWSIQGDAMGMPGIEHHMVTKPGTGILVNQPTPGKN